MQNPKIENAANNLFNLIEDEIHQAFNGNVRVRSVHVSNRRSYASHNVVEIRREVKVTVSGSIVFSSPLETFSK